MNIRNVLLAIASVVVAGGVVSCGGGGGGGGGSTAPAPAPAAPATVVRSAPSLTGAKETPPVMTSASGRGAVVVNPTTLEITGGISFKDLTGPPLANPAGAHIHQGAAGVAGPIIIPLIVNSDNATATIPTGTTLTIAQYNALLAGELYFNVHTAANQGGEIRDQITGTTGVTAGLATLNGAQEVPAVPTAATGRGTVVVDSVTREIICGYVTHNVAGANAAHIHTGAPGVSGGITIGLNLGTNVATAAQGATMTAGDLTALAAGNLYFNVHSPTYPDGEIRGQIAVQ